MKAEIYTISVDISESDLPTVSILRKTPVGLPDKLVQTLYGDEATEFVNRYCMSPPEKLKRISDQANVLVAALKKTNDAVVGLLESMNAAVKEVDENV